MKIKKTILDRDITKRIKAQNVSEIAEEMNVSRQYMYDAMNEKYAVTEDFYSRLVEILEDMEVELSCCGTDLDDFRICSVCLEHC